TIKKINKPVVAIFSVLTATTPAATATIPTTETSGNASVALFTCLENKRRTTSPKIIGIKTTWTILINISPADTGNHLLANNKINDGVKIGANKVDTAVTATDKAVFPFAKNVITLEAVPPGQHPTKMTPTATSAGN